MASIRLQTDAIVLRRAPFSETSQVVDLLTPGEGRIAVLARGAYREKNAFGGPLDLLVRGTADVGRRRASELDLLHGFRVTHPYRGLRRELPRWLAAAHALELVRAFAWPRDREPALFHALAGALELIDAAPREAGAQDVWLTALAGRLLDVAGLLPRLDACVACGTEPKPGSALHLSAAQGGLLCAACGAKAPPSARHEAALLPFLRRALSGAGSLSGADVSADVVAEARRAVDEYLEYRLERPLVARRLLDRFGAGRSEGKRARRRNV